MGEINLDANAIKESKLVQEEAEMIEMQNGCICCTLRGDLLRTVKSLSNEGKYDNLIIESTGISEPLPVAQTFVMDIDSAVQPGASPAVATSELKSLSHFATLDTCVTVVDALNVFEVLGSIETLADKNNIANMLGNTGARDYNTDTEQLTAIVQALEWQSLALTDTSMSVQKLVAEMVESPEVLVKHATRIRKQVPGLERVEDSQVLAAAIEISNKYKLREQAAKGGKEGEAAIAAMTAANAAAIKAHEAAQNTDDRSLSQLMLDQIEFANVILISKAALFLSQHSGTDTDGEKKLGMIKGLMKKLNPKARVIIPRADQYGDLDTAELLNTGAFNMREAQTSPGWLQELQQGHHVPETEEYGITSLVFQDKSMPFHPARLRRILNGFGSYESAIAMGSSLLPAPAPAPETASSPELPDQQQAEGSSNAADKVTKSGFTKSRGCFEGVVRAKGFIWLANANAFPISFHAAGKQVNVEGGQRPFAAVMASKETAERMVKAGKWTDMYGDRESCVVFIGVGLNKTLMMKALKEALLTEEESCELGGVQGWAKLEDPFFDGTAAETYMDIPEYLKQHFARQQAGQRHPGQKVFECKFTWDQTSSEIRICVCATNSFESQFVSRPKPRSI
eukprot:SAG31_NODE_709_length_12683_cov_17.695248_2_plen_626_part_00